MEFKCHVEKGSSAGAARGLVNRLQGRREGRGEEETKKRESEKESSGCGLKKINSIRTFYQLYDI